MTFCFFILLAADDAHLGHPWCKVPVEPHLPFLESSCSPFPTTPSPLQPCQCFMNTYLIHLLCFCLVNIFKAATYIAPGLTIWRRIIHIPDIVPRILFVLQKFSSRWHYSVHLLYFPNWKLSFSDLLKDAAVAGRNPVQCHLSFWKELNLGMQFLSISAVEVRLLV